jgi:DNA-binding transcriptional regulator YiaG
MTADEIKSWRKRLRLTQTAAASALGITLRGLQRREAGEVPIDREAELACLYLEEHPEALKTKPA